ncbi:MAG: hypothetical protein ABSE99_12600 [Terracidiphilus sp.]|jgi:hypothetical protein
MQQKTPVAASGIPFPNNMASGLDLGDRWSRYCMLDNAGAVLEENRVRSTEQALEERFGALSATRFVYLKAGYTSATDYGDVYVHDSTFCVADRPPVAPVNPT